MQEKLISFYTAKLSKEKGFDELCDYHYCYGNADKHEPLTGQVFIGGFVDDNGQNRKYKNSELVKWELPYGEFSAPTQALLQTWLREVHKIDIDLCKIKEGYKGYAFTNWDDRMKQTAAFIHKRVGYSTTYQSALEIALMEGLELIQI